MKEKEHHPFCNRFMYLREDCKSCEKLHRDYPKSEGDTGKDLVRRYFPDAKVKGV